MEKFFREAGKGGVKGIDVGFFASAKYQDGTYVAAVAAWNEFGTRKGGKVHIQERPAIRQAVKGHESKLTTIIKKNIDSKKMVVDKTLANKIGESQKGAIQKSMIDLKQPANRPATLRAKFPKTNPLVGKTSGTLIESVTFKVNA